MAKIKTRVDATKDKIALLKEMQGMINQLKSFSARIEERIDTMIAADLESMCAEKMVIEEMEQQIKSKDDDYKRRTIQRARGY